VSIRDMERDAPPETTKHRLVSLTSLRPRIQSQHIIQTIYNQQLVRHASGSYKYAFHPTTQAPFLSSIPSAITNHKPTPTLFQNPEAERAVAVCYCSVVRHKKKVNQARYRDGEDVHGRQEQDAVEEGEPEVGKPGIQGPEAREPGQGAEGQVLHHAPLCHRAGVLQGLGPLICRTGNSDCSFLIDNLDSGSNYLSKKVASTLALFVFPVSV
jgi:hypothetical protein